MKELPGRRNKSDVYLFIEYPEMFDLSKVKSELDGLQCEFQSQTSSQKHRLAKNCKNGWQLQPTNQVNTSGMKYREPV